MLQIECSGSIALIRFLKMCKLWFENSLFSSLWCGIQTTAPLHFENVSETSLSMVPCISDYSFVRTFEFS